MQKRRKQAPVRTENPTRRYTQRYFTNFECVSHDFQMNLIMGGDSHSPVKNSYKTESVIEKKSTSLENTSRFFSLDLFRVKTSGTDEHDENFYVDPRAQYKEDYSKRKQFGRIGRELGERENICFAIYGPKKFRKHTELNMICSSHFYDFINVLKPILECGLSRLASDASKVENLNISIGDSPTIKTDQLSKEELLSQSPLLRLNSISPEKLKKQKVIETTIVPIHPYVATASPQLCCPVGVANTTQMGFYNLDSQQNNLALGNKNVSFIPLPHISPTSPVEIGK